MSVLAEKYLRKSLQEVQFSAMIGDLVKTALNFDVEIPSDFMLVGKALKTIEGIGKERSCGVEHLSRAGYELPMCRG